MKKYCIIKILLSAVLVLITAIASVRFINGLRFPGEASEHNSVDIQDMSAYPLEYEGLTVKEIKQNRLNGFHVVPDNKTSKGLVVTLGGSEGGCNYFKAVALAQNGFEVIALFYFGQDNQSAKMNKVPIDFFEEFLLYSEDNDMDIEPLTLIGGSKGAELSLLLTNYYDEIDNIILYSPSSYVFQGLDFENAGSSWTYKNQELPYISLHNASTQSLAQMFSAFLFNYPVSYRSQYETAVQNSKNSSAAFIDSSNFKGNILMFSGADDAMWHSAEMAEQIYEKNTANAKNIVYENVGHLFENMTYGYGVAFGGIRENNQAAKAESDMKELEFLSKFHK